MTKQEKLAMMERAVDTVMDLAAVLELPVIFIFMNPITETAHMVNNIPIQQVARILSDAVEVINLKPPMADEPRQ